MGLGDPLYGKATQVRDNLLYGGEYYTKPIDLADNNSATDTYAVRGSLVAIDANGRGVVLDLTATVIALDATGEVLIDNLLAAAGVIPRPFTLSKPPIPGTVTIATTANASATPVLVLGTDNSNGYGSGAGGFFTVDYTTGKGVAYPNAASTNGDDLKAGFSHRTASGEPEGILIHTHLGTAVAAGPIASGIYVAGRFNKLAVPNWSAGYERGLRLKGIHMVTAQLL